MTECALCGQMNEGYGRFCRGCGGTFPGELKTKSPPQCSSSSSQNFCCVTPIPIGLSRLICNRCNQEVAPGYSFCSSCGAKVQSANNAKVGSRPKLTPTPGRLNTPSQVFGTGKYKSLGDKFARLHLINPNGTDGPFIPLPIGETMVGRQSQMAILNNDLYLSPRQASFFYSDGKVVIKDLGSLNGTLFRLRGTWALQNGDVFRAGQQLLQFEVLDFASPIHQDGTSSFGSPHYGAWGRLTQIVSPDESGDAYLLYGREEVVGRERGTLIFANDGFISSIHCKIWTDGEENYLSDLDSSNGTFVVIREQIQILPGDIVLLGQQLFILRI